MEKIIRRFPSLLPKLKSLDAIYYSDVVTKSKKYKNIKWETPLPSEDNLPAEKVVDKTGKPRQIDDKMVKVFRTPGME